MLREVKRKGCLGPGKPDREKLKKMLLKGSDSMLYRIYMQTQDLRFQQAAQGPVCHGCDWTALRGQVITENVPWN